MRIKMPIGFAKGNLQEPEKIHFNLIIKEMKFQLSRITSIRKSKGAHSYNDFLGEMGIIFSEKVNTWIKDL